MPNLCGTEPQGLGPMTGRGIGRCIARKDIDRPLPRPTPSEPGEDAVYGAGRGGRPCGGGRGNCFGGGNSRRGVGRRFGR